MENFAQNYVKLDIFGTFLFKKGVNLKSLVAALCGVAAVLCAGVVETRGQGELSWTDPQLATMTAHLVCDGLDYGAVRPCLDWGPLGWWGAVAGVSGVSRVHTRGRGPPRVSHGVRVARASRPHARVALWWGTSRVSRVAPWHARPGHAWVAGGALVVRAARVARVARRASLVSHHGGGNHGLGVGGHGRAGRGGTPP